MTKKSLLAFAAALAAAGPAISYADVAFNVGAVSDYRYRGISQSRLKPAVQGGVDYSNGPFYLGAWASTIKWIKDTGGDAQRSRSTSTVATRARSARISTYDVGVLAYQYPGNNLGNASPPKNANTTEIYGALTYGPATLKYSHAVTNIFGNPDSKNSYYLDLSAGFDVGSGVTLTPHVGYQKITGVYDSLATYTDYSLTVSKDFSGIGAERRDRRHRRRQYLVRASPQRQGSRQGQPGGRREVQLLRRQLMKMVTAIVKPFKLDEVREALSAHRRARHHGDRSQGLRPPEGPHRAVPRRRVRGRLPAQGEDRSRGRRRARRPRDRGHRSRGPHRQDRRRQDLRHARSSRWCASAPARPARTRSDSP